MKEQVKKVQKTKSKLQKKKKTEKPAEEEIEQPAQDSSEAQKEEEQEEPEQKKPTKKKEIFLKQWHAVVVDEDGKRFQIYVLATCGLKAREFILQRFKNASILAVVQSAESEKEASWLETHSPFYD